MLVAIVEDDARDEERLRSYISRYADERGTVIDVRSFVDGMNFVDDYSPDCDIIFFDIEMPFLSGMDAAREIRKRDAEVAIVFVTDISQYAIDGYDVGAVDYLLKPIEYAVFSDRFARAGGDIWLAGMGFVFGDNLRTDNATDMYCARNAAKNVIYTLADTINFNHTADRSELDSAFNVSVGVAQRNGVFPWWVIILVLVDVLAVAGCGVWVFFAVRKKDK